MIRWEPVLDAARGFVESYDTLVTLRQLFYRLVAALLIDNTQHCYKRLSECTAKGRRDGTFPELMDRTRQIHEYETFHGVADALSYTRGIYRRDRTEGQDVSLYLAVEKAGIVNQLDVWFGDPLGLPILALGGYASQSYVNEIVCHVSQQQRPAVLLYAGDHDPSGWDIPRDFVGRTNCWKEVRRIALDPDLIAEHDLPESIGKESDSRKAWFVEQFGKLVQVELDALPPNVLRGLYTDAIEEFWDLSAFESVLAREQSERDALGSLNP